MEEGVINQIVNAILLSYRFTNPMPFDDKKFSYHMMLQYFMTSQGFKAFFDIFEWALEVSSEGASE